MMKISNLIFAPVSAVVVLAPGYAWAQQPEVGRYGCGANMMEWSGGYGMMFGSLMMFLVLALVIAVAILLVRWLRGPWHPMQSTTHAPPPARTALDILKERYAQGEIDKSEFDERRRTLGD